MFPLRPNQTGGVRVPPYPRLKRTTDQIDAQTRSIREGEEQIAHLERTLAKITNQETSLTSLNETSSKLHEIAKQIEQVETERRGAESAIQGLREEHQQWLDFFAQLLYRQQQLKNELGTALLDDQSVPDMVLGANVTRTKSVVADELLSVIWRIANFSDDPKLQREALQFQKEVEAQRPYIILRKSYARLRDGRVVSEDEMQRLGCEHGSDSPFLKGALSAFPRGARVQREEAAKWGLV